jgi:hypothetical protein
MSAEDKAEKKMLEELEGKISIEDFLKNRE